MFNDTNKKIKYPLLSIDLDGTLLNKFKKISKKDLIALKTYNANKGIIFINTGKNLKQTIKIINKLNNNLIHPIRYFSCLNGNIIYDLQEQKIIQQNCINKFCVKEVIDISKKYHYQYCYYKKVDDTIKRIYNKKNIDNDDVIYKFNIISFFRNLNKNIDLNQDLSNINNINYFQTNKHLYEIVKMNVNKGQSLKFICEKLNINLNDVASIGDSLNDLSMFNLNNNAFLVKQRLDENLNQAANFKLNLKHHRVATVINDYVLKN